MQIDSNVNRASNVVALDIAKFMLKNSTLPIILCVGCDNVVGDSLAPIVGHILKSKYNLKTYVYGDFNCNVTAQNISTVVAKIREWHSGAPIIVVDATLGRVEDIGSVQYYEGGCYPAGVYKPSATKVGDYCLLGVVGIKGTDKYAFLHGVRLGIVNKLAHTLADSVAHAFEYTNALSDVWH
jgi:putative sporulation protein YyaC